MLFFLEFLGVLGLIFVLWKRGTFQRTAKAEEQAAPVGRGHIWYVKSATKQKGTTILLLHDFAADKSQWSALMPLLEKESYNVVAPDLPGFGSNLRDIDGKYDATSMAKSVRSFARAADLGMFHLVGAGTGALIAASYAYGMPTELASVTLIEPMGLTAPGESDFDKVMQKGRNALLPVTPQAYEHLLGFVAVSEQKTSAAVKKKRAETLAANREFYARVWSELREGDRKNLLDLLLPEITARTLVLFGAKSRIVHPSTAKMVEKRLEGRNARVVVVPDAGHWVMIDQPKALCDALVAFFRAPVEPKKKKEPQPQEAQT